MSLSMTPVTQADIEQLQLGIQFFVQPIEAANEAAAINAGTTTVYDYAVQLISTQISVAQVAVADSSLMEGATVAAGTPQVRRTRSRGSRRSSCRCKSGSPWRMALIRRYLLRRPSVRRWEISRAFKTLLV